MNTILSKLKKVNLREAWAHEAMDFTNWLAMAENLNQLGEAIGCNLELVNTEVSVGRFNLDILAKDADSDKNIVIENQLENTDHDHLGKIITYASGLDASTVIWIVKDARDEHRKAIDWLNEHTDIAVGFFLIKIELWQIDNSKYAPTFNILSKPNDWAKAIKADSNSGQLTDTRQKQLQFWTDFKAYVEEKEPKLSCRKPAALHWYDFSIGMSSVHIDLLMHSRENFFGCGLYITKNKDLFDFLESHKATIEEALGCECIWDRDAGNASRIKSRKYVDDVFSNTPDHFEWLLASVLKFKEIFGKLCKKYKAK